MNMQFTTFFSVLFGAYAALVAAAPVEFVTRDVWSPRVTYPQPDTVWTRGEKRNVTWDTSDAPEHISNGARVQLRWNDRISPLILADGFDLRKGYVEITVPWVVNSSTYSNYSLVLFGDSGNYSPTFSIKGE